MVPGVVVVGVVSVGGGVVAVGGGWPVVTGGAVEWVGATGVLGRTAGLAPVTADGLRLAFRRRPRASVITRR